MKLLLTGGRGLVGGPLARKLGRHHEVVATDLPELDVTDAPSVARTFAAHRPDAVVHLAAWTDVDGCERDPARALGVNGGGTRVVASACREAKTPLVYVSTDYVFDGTKEGPYVETDPVRPISAYGRSKLAGEDAVRELVPAWTIVRSQSIYGEGKKSFVDAILARAAAGGALSVVTDQRVSPTWAEHLAEALARVVQSGRQGLYHVANAGSCTWFECARAALDMSGHAKTEVAGITAASLGRAAPRPANSAFDCSKYDRDVGPPMPPWRVALQAYLATRAARAESA